MVRYLLLRHPIAVCVVLFIAAMLAIRLVVAPAIVGHFGDAGFVVTMLAIFTLGLLIDRGNE